MSDVLPLTTRDAFEDHCRARASAVYVGGRTLLCRVMGRFLCYVDSEDAAVGAHLAMDGFWEAWNCLAIGRHVRPGWRVVDVGANHGYFTLLLAELVGPDGHVFAVEPNPCLFELLRRTVRLNGFDDRVTLLPYAAAAVDGEADLRVPRWFSGDGSARQPLSAEGTVFRVPQRRLDALIDDPIDFLKVDAEGADYDALEGALGLLPRERAAAVLLEHHAPYHDRASERLMHLARDGFALQYVGFDGELAPGAIDELEQEPVRFWDLWLNRAPREE